MDGRVSKKSGVRWGGAVVAGALVLALALASAGPALACYATTASESRAKNLIVFVVEGFGFGTQAVGRISLAGPDNRLQLESLPYVGMMSHRGRTRLGTDDSSALWALIWGVRADVGERPPEASQRASWLTAARRGGRAVGIVSDGALTEGGWPLGAVVRPGETTPGRPGERLLADPPDFLFAWQTKEAWQPEQKALAEAKVAVSQRWEDRPTAGARAWYLLQGTPPDPLGGESSPRLAEVTGRALEKLASEPQGFVLLIHAGGLGEALSAHDLALTVAHLGQLDEAVGKAQSFAEQTEGTAVLVVSTGDPTGLAMLDGFTPRRLDGVVKPLAEVAAAVKAAATPQEGCTAIRQGLGVEATVEEVSAWRSLPAATLAVVLGDRVASTVGVRFGSERTQNPVPVLAYGPGSWVYGRLLDATELPALATGQLWLDPSALTAK